MLQNGPLALLLVLAVVGLLLCAAPAAAAEEGGAEDNPLVSPRVDLAIWSIIIFVLLLLLLRKTAWGPMLDAFHKRERSIADAIKEAEEARASAHSLRQDLEAHINKSHEQVRDLLDEGRKEAQAARDRMLAEARGEVQAERERLHREIDMARDQALQQIWTQAAQLATLVSSKVIRRKLTPEDHSGLIEEALADLRRVAKQRQQASIQ
jgi:F-type H+-transporting ATPase subunit b